MSVIYIDTLSIFSLFKLIFLGPSCAHIFYFNAGHYSKKIVKFLKRIGILKFFPEEVKFHFSDIKDKNNVFIFKRVINDIRHLCLEVRRKEFKTNNFLNGFKDFFDFEKILIFYEKILAIELNETVIFMNAIEWHLRTKGYSCPAVFLLEKGMWSKYFLQYGKTLNIKLVSYHTFIHSSCRSFLKKSGKFLLRKIENSFKISQKNRNAFLAYQVKPRKDVCIGAYYSGRSISFDLNKRSDFFWLLRSDITHDRLLVYFDRFEATDMPISDEKIKIFNKEGIDSVALFYNNRNSKSLPIWHSTKNYAKTKKHLIKSAFKNISINFMKGGRNSLFYIGYMFYFIDKYAYWLDFFKSNNIKINICPDDFQVPYVPMVTALEKNGGINISYQWSNMDFSSITMSNCSSIMFSFGPNYRAVWEKEYSTVGNIVYCGYITDHSFKELKKDSFILRKRLLENGASFVICFFDENSSDDRFFPISNKRTTKIYKYLLEKLLEDKTLALIFKPGFPKTIYQRISPINNLIKAAAETGRCVFIDKGEWLTEQLPAETAQAADLCIGLLFSGTAILEAFLSGTPSIFIDLEGFYSNQIYNWGRGKVVFDDLNEMFSAIKDYQYNAIRNNGFGNLSSWAKGKDPFKDGNASLRIGQYISWLLEAFSQNKKKDLAILYASKKYTDLWGKDKIVNLTN